MTSKKLVHKLIVLSIVPVIISMILFGSISYSIYKDQLVNQRMDEARSVILLSSEEIENPLYFAQLDKLNAIIRNIKNNPNVITVFVMDAKGKVVTDGTNENRFYGQIFTDNFSERSIKSQESIVVIENEVLRISSPVVINEKIGTIMIDFSLEELDTVLMGLLILLGAIGTIIVIVISTINLSISNSIFKPVTELMYAANEIAKGNFSARIEKRSDDEIGELTGTFNKMAEDLQRSSDERKQAEDKLHLLSMAVEQSTDGIAVVNMEGNILSINKEFDPGLSYIEADQQRLKQILFNLLSNAVKFSKPGGGTVTITAKKEGDMAKFSVSDTGIGIKDENIDKLFSAFEQLDSGITKNYGGTGLGLAITKKLVELHDGTITVESTYGEGSTFTFTLPLVSKKSGGTDRLL